MVCELVKTEETSRSWAPEPFSDKVILQRPIVVVTTPFANKEVVLLNLSLI